MKYILTILILFSFLALNAYSYPQTPNQNLSPGSYCTTSHYDFDELRYDENIAHCRRHVSSRTKNKVCRRDGVYDRNENYTVDHIIPLSLGGDNSEENLWCQHKSLHTGRIEYHYYVLVRDGKMRRDDAVNFLLRCKFLQICD